MNFVQDQLRRFGYLFYVANPNQTSFKTVEEIPNYVNSAYPQFMVLVALEVLVLVWKNSKIRINDMLTSASHGMLYLVTTYATRGVELVGYNWIYQRRIFDLDWSSPLTWWTAALGADFGYYWFHRFIHEMAFGWAAHQVHHSSEDYNLSTAMRKSVFQKFFSFGFYFPCAVLGVPLPALLVHLQFNLLYQFWIHTEIVSSIGPLEWILNTPSHHRVHHGANPWCLDKNYAGVLIIWDRMFGTFEPERKGDKITYGLVKQPQTLNIVWLQVFYYKYIFEKAAAMKNWSDSFKALFFSPGWAPQEKPASMSKNKPKGGKKFQRQKYDPKLPFMMEVYVTGHFFVSLALQQSLMTTYNNISWVAVLLHMLYLLITLGNIGAIYDGWKYASLVEGIRSAMVIVFSLFYALSPNYATHCVLVGYSFISAIVCTAYAFISKGKRAKGAVVQ